MQGDSREAKVTIDPREPAVEEIAAALIQVFFEFFLEVLIYIGLDFASMRDAKGKPHGCALSTLMALSGMLMGVVVNWLHPHPVLPFPGLRIANLFVGPVLAGALSAYIARWRGRDPWVHFWLALCFVLGYNLVRFAFAKV